MNCRVDQLEPGDEIFHRGKWRTVENVAWDFDNIYAIGIDIGTIWLSNRTLVMVIHAAERAVAEAERIVRGDRK